MLWRQQEFPDSRKFLFFRNESYLSDIRNCYLEKCKILIGAGTMKNKLGLRIGNRKICELQLRESFPVQGIGA